jgi:hypothetical protein
MSPVDPPTHLPRQTPAPARGTSPDGPATTPDTVRDVILFDGVCDLCNTGAAWVSERDGAGRFEFVAYQGPGVAARSPGSTRRASPKRCTS